MAGDVLPRFVAAAVQAAPVFLDREATVQKACRLILEASARGARLIVFPETWVPGYPVWASRIPAYRNSVPGRALFGRLYRNAVDVPSAATDELAWAARQAGAVVVMGINEREAQFGRGTLYNTLLIIDSQGRVQRHRKLMPTFHERTIWGLGDGSTLSVVETPLGRVGGLICWEHWMPLARYGLYAQGEQVHAALWPSSFPLDDLNGEMVQIASRHYAHEGRVFVVAACGFFTRDMLPPDFELAEESKGWPDLLLTGGSAIIGPYGDYLAGPAPPGETILYAELDLEQVAEARQSLDVTGHYARPDVLQLLLHAAPQQPVARPKRETRAPQEETPPPEAPEHLQEPMAALESLRHHITDEWLDLG